MKPLSANKLQEFLNRFDNFQNGEFRSLELISPIQIEAVFALQDSARGFDWLTIKLQFNSVNDAVLLDGSKLSLVDTEEGISLLYQDNNFHFSLGDYKTTSNMKNSNCYIFSPDIKYEEGSF